MKPATRLPLPLLAVAVVVMYAPRASAAPSDVLWSTEVDGPAHGFDAGNDLVLDPTGARVFVAGQTSSPRTGVDFTTMAFDPATGAALWSATTATRGLDQALSIASSPDGSLAFAAGTTRQSGRRGGDFLTVAYDAVTGQTLWTRRYDSHAGPETAADVLALSDLVVVSGLDASNDAVTIAYHPTTGAILWTSTVAGPMGAIIGVEGDQDGIYIAGYSFTGPTFDYFAAAYDLAGQERWRFTYDGPANFGDTVDSAAMSGDGDHLYLTGESDAPFGSSDITTIALSTATGTVEWIARIDEPVGSEDQEATLVASASGALTAVAFTRFNNVGERSLVIVGIDATGTLPWTTQRAAGIRARGGEMAPDGTTLYLVGNVDTLGEVDAHAFAMDAVTGALSWERTLGAAGFFDNAEAIDITADGSTAFVTGSVNDNIWAAALDLT